MSSVTESRKKVIASETDEKRYKSRYCFFKVNLSYGYLITIAVWDKKKNNIYDSDLSGYHRLPTYLNFLHCLA